MWKYVHYYKSFLKAKAEWNGDRQCEYVGKKRQECSRWKLPVTTIIWCGAANYGKATAAFRVNVRRQRSLRVVGEWLVSTPATFDGGAYLLPVAVLPSFTDPTLKQGSHQLWLGWPAHAPGVKPGLPDCVSSVLTTTLSKRTLGTSKELPFSWNQDASFQYTCKCEYFTEESRRGWLQWPLGVRQQWSKENHGRSVKWNHP